MTCGPGRPAAGPGPRWPRFAATGWSVLAAACLLWPGLGTARPDAHLPAGFAGQRGLFELLVLAAIAVIAAAATAYCVATSGHVRYLITIRRLSRQKYY